MAWYPGYEERLIIPTDPALHQALMRTTAQPMTDVLRDIPEDALGDIDCPIFHIRKNAPRSAQVSRMESEDYRGLLTKGGLRLGP